MFIIFKWTYITAQLSGCYESMRGNSLDIYGFQEKANIIYIDGEFKINLNFFLNQNYLTNFSFIRTKIIFLPVLIIIKLNCNNFRRRELLN